MIRLSGALLLFSTMITVGFVSVQAGEKQATGFVNKIYKDKDADIKYIVFVPKDYDGTKEFPVILFLHGSGESGTDGEKQAKGGLGKAIRDKKEKFPFITVFPQSQKGGWGTKGNEAPRVLAILDEVEKTYKTDKKRVYLTGLSMGGGGTWKLAVAHPTRWAAIAPICGKGDLSQVGTIKDIPCWCFVGDADAAATVENSRAMIKALKDAGANARYSEYAKVGHNSWDRAYATAELYEWFLKHSTK